MPTEPLLEVKRFDIAGDVDPDRPLREQSAEVAFFDEHDSLLFHGLVPWRLLMAINRSTQKVEGAALEQFSPSEGTDYSG